MISENEKDRWLARSLSVQQWEFLADHFEGKRLILNNSCSDRVRLANESRTRLALVRLEMIKQLPHVTPTYTELTERGHRAMCAALGLMADMLMANGFNGVMTQTRVGYGHFLSTAGDPQAGGRALQSGDQSA